MNNNYKNQNNINQIDPHQEMLIRTCKSLKAAAIIVFCFVCALEAYAIWSFISMIIVSSANDWSALAILALLPLFIILTLGVCALSITTSILASKWNKKALMLGQQQTIFYNILRYTGWFFALTNVLAFIIFIII